MPEFIEPTASVEAGPLRVAYAEQGPRHGWPVVLLHGFPYDIQAYADVAPLLAARGARVVVPFLRGYGPTRWRTSPVMRSGQQGALAADLHALIDALGLGTPIVAGYDWGGRAACIAAALWPERIAGLVSVNGYNIQDIAAARQPQPPEVEHRLWYQYYFHGERGRLGLERHRAELCRLLWQLWSPGWNFDDATFDRTAASFENPDFVDVVIHSYRHRFGLCEGDPAYASIEQALAAQPDIAVPAITLDGLRDGVAAAGPVAHGAAHFVGRHEHRTLEGVGHNLPQEAPEAFAQAVLDLHEAG